MFPHLIIKYTILKDSEIIHVSAKIGIDYSVLSFNDRGYAILT